LIFVARRESCSWRLAWGGAIVLGATGWFFVSTGWLGYFDSWLVVSLIVASQCRPRWFLWLACILAPWIDERFIIGLPLIFALRYLKSLSANTRAAENPVHDELQTLRVAAMLAAIFVATRLWLAGRWGSLGVLEYLKMQQTWTTEFGRHLLGMWESLRCGWFFVAVGGVALLRSISNPLRILFLIVVTATIATSLAVANDLSRSMTVLVPLAVEGLIAMRQWHRFATTVICLLFALCLLLPAQHVVTDFTRPIPRLADVYHAWTNPENDLSPKAWVQRAKQLMQENRGNDAARCIDLALRLDGKCAAAYDTRGLLSGMKGQWRAASDDFEIACRLSPKVADFHVHRAVGALQLRNYQVFQLALAEAKRLSPVDLQTKTNIAELEKVVAGLH
jgi:tetratricopeptide (TPR) repeat protein